MLKGRGPTTEELLTERRKERELEEKMERQLGIPPASGRVAD